MAVLPVLSPAEAGSHYELTTFYNDWTLDEKTLKNICKNPIPSQVVFLNYHCFRVKQGKNVLTVPRVYWFHRPVFQSVLCVGLLCIWIHEGE